jgi:hypothetical protein
VTGRHFETVALAAEIQVTKMGTAGLSLSQRIKRRISLWGGSYEHPDGHIELDFEEPAGIDSRTDSEKVQLEKLVAYEARQNINTLKVTYFISGGVMTYMFMRYLY